MLQTVQASTAPSTTEPDLRTASLRAWGGGIGALRLQEADADKNQLGHYRFVKLVPSISVSFLKSPGNAGRINTPPVLEDALAARRERAAFTNSTPTPKSCGEIWHINTID